MDNGSSFYDNCWTVWTRMKPVGATARHTRRIISNLLRNMVFSNILDVGCGDGLLLDYLKCQFPTTQISGSEYSLDALEMAKSRLPQAEFFELNLAKQHVNKKYDLVTCIDVIEHIDDDLQALKNLQAMTNKYLLICVPLGPLFENERNYLGHLHGYSRKEFENKLTLAGLKVLRAEQWGFPFYNLIRRATQNTLVPSTAPKNDKSNSQKLLWKILYYLYFLSLPWGGERYFAITIPNVSQ